MYVIIYACTATWIYKSLFFPGEELPSFYINWSYFFDFFPFHNYKIIMLSTESPSVFDKDPSYYSRSAIRSRVNNMDRHSSLHQVFKKVKTSLFEKRDHQEKRPQDGKTNPME